MLIKFGIVAAGVLMVLAGLRLVYNAGYDASDDKWVKANAIARVAHLEAIREVEAEKQLKINEVSQNAKAEIKILEAALVNVATERNSLHDAATNYAKRLSACSRDGGGGRPAEAPLNLLPGLLNRCAGRVEELAGYAVRLEVALTACRASYQVNAQ